MINNKKELPIAKECLNPITMRSLKKYCINDLNNKKGGLKFGTDSCLSILGVNESILDRDVCYECCSNEGCQ